MRRAVLAFVFVSAIVAGPAGPVCAQQGPPPPPPPPMGPPSMTPARDNTGAPRPLPVGTASIAGTVVNDVTGKPVRRVTIRLTGGDAGLRLTAVTGDDGRFVFTDLPANRYTINASRPSFVATAYGARRPGRPGTPVAVVDGQARTDLVIRLLPGGVITGTVRGQTGEPLPGARVIALRQAFSYTNGERTLQPGNTGLGAIADDRGEYRIFGLSPDAYFVVVMNGLTLTRNSSELRMTTAEEIEWATRQLQGSAVAGAPSAPPAPGAAIDYAPVFYPGSPTQAGASSVEVKAGDTRSGIDVIVDATPTASILGTVVPVNGEPLPGVMVNVIAHDTIPGVPFSGFGSARVDRSGKFVSAGLVPGTYTVAVRALPGPAGPSAQTSAMFGTATVFINGQDVETTVTFQTGVSISGRIALDESQTNPPNMNTIRVSLSPIASKVPTLGVAAVPVDASGRFTIKGVTPGRYRLSPNLPTGWRARSATLQGVDWLDENVEIGAADVEGVELRLTDRQTEIAGALLDATDRPAQDFFIIVYASDSKYWGPLSRRVQMTRPGSDGRYKVANLPPGDYYIAALTDVEQNEWLDPAFLTQLVPASTKVALAEGEKKEQSLRIK
jgi:uncharacterized protein (DUF2141 family)